MTRFKLENLINYNFDSNRIDDFGQLDHLSDLPLRELVLTNNPISSKPNYRMEVAKRFPDLQFLDGVAFTPADFPPSPIPPLRPSYSDTIERQQFAYRFLEKYFTTFDKDRINIVKAYTEDSVFSMTFTASDVRGASKNYQRHNRNLLKSLNLEKRTDLLFVGIERIYNFFKIFPQTSHNLTTPVVDIFLVPKLTPESTDALYVITHGFFTETSFCTKRSFDHTFVLVPSAPNSEAAKQGWEAVILNEQLHIRPYVRFPRLEPLEAAPVSVPTPVAAATPDQDQLIKQFVSMTSLKDEFALECLVHSGWDINNAMSTLQALKSQNKIPAHYFK
ncbi:hypothetical protein SAMD00019534_044800 [Acytostelium subglobosum LB1]|uniref:hypothetical protein n=1 Tax=Acytostelium subglobosum LB1 TaxID=1410327 RepID=UPI000645126A|nr:hypothetical protein SAMD00019534_044800 [Acytostelium subglobosum LB1]GAM21305.1 hypothetical protein SAMD00019534_044800 [Acytostelium subglobosum LB1]|eukprot:XP_012755424.1 hypothetical protein SAMD00019534_044800 [Acytostelium subglobosum LB1]